MNNIQEPQVLDLRTHCREGEMEPGDRMENQKLYLVHCGYYDDEVGQGIFENHTNFFVVSSDFASARLRAKERPEFQAKRMHIDGIQEIEMVDGYQIQPLVRPEARGSSQINNFKHRELATLKKNDGQA